MEDLHNKTGIACPELPTLLAWYTHQAEDHDSLALKQHVLSCPHCQAHINDLAPIPVNGRPALTLIISPATTEEHRESPDSEQLRPRPDLKVISVRHRAPAAGARGAATPEARHARFPVPTSGPAGHFAGSHLSGFPVSTVSPPTAAGPTGGTAPVRRLETGNRSTRPGGVHRLPEGERIQVRAAALIILMLLCLLTVGYTTWYSLYRVPALREVIQAARQPTIVEMVDTLPLEPQPLRLDRLPEPTLSFPSSQPHVLLRIALPDAGPKAQHELILLDSQGTVLWNHMRVNATDGYAQLVISPVALGAGTFTVRAVTTLPTELPRTHQARLRIQGPLP